MKSNINDDNVISNETRQEFLNLKQRILEMKQDFESRRIENNDYYTSPEEKTEMKFLYKRYLLLKDQIDSASSNPKQIYMQELQQKKKDLQKKLYDYQTNFQIANGHQVRGADDMGPLKQEYNEYKVLLLTRKSRKNY